MVHQKPTKKRNLDKIGGNIAPPLVSTLAKKRHTFPVFVIIRLLFQNVIRKNEIVNFFKRELVKIDGKIRIDPKFPVGLMDVISCDNISKHYRILTLASIEEIGEQEARFKLCRVEKLGLLGDDIPYLVTHDERVVRHPDAAIAVGDSVKIDLESGEIAGHFPFGPGRSCLISDGQNIGKKGTVVKRIVLPNGIDKVYFKTSSGEELASKFDNIFIIGDLI